MTVQVDSQSVTDQIMWYNDMCYINNSISCLRKKTAIRNIWSDMLCPPQFLSKFHKAKTWWKLLRQNFTIHSASPASFIVLVLSRLDTYHAQKLSVYPKIMKSSLCLIHKSKQIHIPNLLRHKFTLYKSCSIFRACLLYVQWRCVASLAVRGSVS